MSPEQDLSITLEGHHSGSGSSSIPDVKTLIAGTIAVDPYDMLPASTVVILEGTYHDDLPIRLKGEIMNDPVTALKTCSGIETRIVPTALSIYAGDEEK